MNSARRSGRQRVPNKKYQDDAIEILNSILSSDSEEEAIIQQKAADPAEDEDFPEDAAIEVSSDSDSGASSNVSEGSAIATPMEDYEDAHSYASSEADVSTWVSGNRHRPKSRNQWGAQTPGTRSRGIADKLFTQKTERPIAMSGPGKENIAHISRSVNQWGDDLTLPRRVSMRHCFSHTLDKRQMEETRGWDWYYDHGGKELFTKRQRMSAVSEDERVKYTMKSSRVSHDVLLGPYGRQKLFTIPALQSLSVEDSWNVAKDEPPTSMLQEPQKGQRSGWLLNVGSRVRCLDWAGNHYGDKQYLAIATKMLIPKDMLKEAPSFTPSPPTPSNIQIWQFSASAQQAHRGSSVNMDHAPVLKQMLCSEWGDAKQLKWCPMPRVFREVEAGKRINIGLLAGVWDDGSARVLDINDDRCDDDGTIYCTSICFHVVTALLNLFTSCTVKVESAACTIPPLSNSICTTLCWLSSSDLAVGHSNGFLAIYSIAPKSPKKSDPPLGSKTPSSGLASGTPSSTSNEPIFPTRRALVQVAQTYLMSITTAYPSFPSLLASSSASGYTRLTSLVSPASSFVQSRRSYNAPTTIVYHHALYGCMLPDDGKEAVTYTGLRFWGNSVGTADATGYGGIPALDVGKVHAAVAFGTADGRVVVTNPIRKILKPKGRAWQLTLFKHEWVRKPGQSTETEDNTMNCLVGDRVEGISRITESYKPQPADVDRSYRSSILPAIRGGASRLTTTIYEEETGVTAVCWNPNLSCGGWLAVGWGSGLARVEDVAV